MPSNRKTLKITAKETVLFGILGAVIELSKLLLEFLPNVHLVAVFIVAFTVHYRKKAIWCVAVFILLEGLLHGFTLWWVPYLYVWPLLWLAVLFLPRFKSKKVAAAVYCAVCSLHGFLYGTLYAPFQALAFGLDFNGTVAWIIAGLPFDAIHGVSNFVCGILILPIISLLSKTDKLIKN